MRFFGLHERYVGLHLEGVPARGFGERLPRPLRLHPVVALMSPEGVRHKILEDLLHREQQGLVHMLAGEGRQPMVEQEQPHPVHHRFVVVHGAVDSMLSPVQFRLRRLGHLGEADAKLMQQLLVGRMGG